MSILSKIIIGLVMVLAVAWVVSLSRPATGQQAMAQARAAATIRQLNGQLSGQLVSYASPGVARRPLAPGATVLAFLPAPTSAGAKAMAAEILAADRVSRELAQQVLFIGIDIEQPTVTAAQGAKISALLGLAKISNWQMGSVSASVLASWRTMLRIPSSALSSGWLLITGHTGQLHWLLIEPPKASLVDPYAELDSSYALAVALR